MMEWKDGRAQSVIISKVPNEHISNVSTVILVKIFAAFPSVHST